MHIHKGIEQCKKLFWTELEGPVNEINYYVCDFNDLWVVYANNSYFHVFSSLSIGISLPFTD